MQSEFLIVGLEAVKKAEDIIMKYYHGEFDIELKADETPVTVADREAENIIIKTIQETFPDHGFLGEEFGDNDGTSEYTWIIDPIDGTSNFVRRIPLFGTLVTLMKGDEIILGISNMPAIGELLYAEKGGGAFLNNDPVQVSDISSVEESMVCFGGLNGFGKYGTEQQMLKLALDARRNRGIGDCYMYHLLASGRCDAVIEGKVSVWDVALFSIIIEEAGGKVTEMSGKSVGLKTKDIVATNGRTHEGVLEYFA